MDLETRRLRIASVKDTDEASEFLPIFNSNPAYIEAFENLTGKSRYDSSDVEMYLWIETTRENSHCLSIRLRASGELIGIASLVVPHPREPYPWIGLLLIHKEYQGKGFGKEALAAIEEVLAAQGWPEVRLGALKGLPEDRRFWEQMGYAVYREALDVDKRACWLMHKPLPPKRVEQSQT